MKIIINTAAVIFMAAVACLAEVSGHDPYIMEGSVDIQTEPLLIRDLVLPQAFQKTLEHYKEKRYRLAILELERFIDINLPDDRAQIYHFMMGECYKQLGLEKFSLKSYTILIENSKTSSYRPYALFRLQEYFYRIGRYDKAESFYSKLLSEYPAHPLLPDAYFTQSKQTFLTTRYDEAFELAGKITPGSHNFLAATFLKGLCCAEQKNHQKAILFFDHIVKKNKKDDLHYETMAMLGNLYFRLKRYPIALKIFSKIPGRRSQYYNAMLKSCKIYLATDNPLLAVDIAEDMLDRYYESEYIIEIFYLLGESYERLGDKNKISKLQELMSLYMRKTKLNFMIFREKTKLSIIRKSWDTILLKEIERKGKCPETNALEALVNAELMKLESLEKRLDELWFQMNPSVTREMATIQGGLTEIRFLELLKSERARIQSNIISLNKQANILGASPDKRGELNRIKADLAVYKRKLADVEGLRDDVVTLCMSSQAYLRKMETLQAKFVDWGFLRIYETRDRIIANYNKITQAKKKIEHYKTIMPKEVDEEIKKLKKIPAKSLKPAPKKDKNSGGKP